MFDSKIASSEKTHNWCLIYIDEKEMFCSLCLNNTKQNNGQKMLLQIYNVVRRLSYTISERKHSCTNRQFAPAHRKKRHIFTKRKRKMLPSWKRTIIQDLVNNIKKSNIYLHIIYGWSNRYFKYVPLIIFHEVFWSFSWSFFTTFTWCFYWCRCYSYMPH